MTEGTSAVRHPTQSRSLPSFRLRLWAIGAPKRQESTLNTNLTKFRRPVLVATAVIALGLAACGQGSGAETVDSGAGAASASPRVELTPSIGMTPDAYERWAAAEVAATYRGMSPDAIEQWRTPNAAFASNYYPHGYSYGADASDSVPASADATERWSLNDDPVPLNYYPHGYDYTTGPLAAS
jgi:hypothetical protein